MLASREKISTRQTFILFIILLYAPMIRFPVLAADLAGKAAWLTPVATILPFMGLIYILQALFKSKTDENLSDIFNKVLGKVAGKILSTLYLFWILVTLGIRLRFFSEKFLTSLLPNTPMNFFNITILALVYYSVRGGIVYLTRTIEFLSIIFSVLFLILFILSVPNLEIINLFPVTHYDFFPVLRSGIKLLGLFGYVIFMFFFADRINDKEHIKKFGLQSLIYVTISAMLILIQTIGIFGYTVTERLSIPYIFVIKTISLMETIERIDSVAIVLNIIVDFASISVFTYTAAYIIKSLFSLSDTKHLTSPVILFTFIFTQYFVSSKFELEYFTRYISDVFNIALAYFFPTVTFIVGKIRKII